MHTAGGIFMVLVIVFVGLPPILSTICIATGIAPDERKEQQ